MKNTLLIILILSLAFSGVVFSQEAKFESTTYDYGLIKEEDGPKKGRYNLTNIGDDTLRILSVRPGCGCTASEYTKTPIPPGGQGYIDATYNPAGRPGKFTKGISVTTNCKVKPDISLYIQGEVIPRPKSKADQYPHAMGNLRVKSAHLSFGDLKNTQKKSDSIGIYNNGKQTISIMFSGLPAFLDAYAVPSLLEPGKDGFIKISYDGSKRNDWGFLLDQLTASTNDESEPLKYFTVNANLLEDFSKFTPKQLLKAPVIAFDTTNINFGTVKAGDKVSGAFNLRNTGKDKLIIRKITSNCPDCITFSASSSVIKKNAPAKISFVYDTKGKPSRQHKTLALITNDPKNPVIVLHIQGTTE